MFSFEATKCAATCHSCQVISAATPLDFVLALQRWAKEGSR
jgi:hypothetical protein